DVVAAGFEARFLGFAVRLRKARADTDEFERAEDFVLGELERRFDVALEEHIAADKWASGFDAEDGGARLPRNERSGEFAWIAGDGDFSHFVEADDLTGWQIGGGGNVGGRVLFST